MRISFLFTLVSNALEPSKTPPVSHTFAFVYIEGFGYYILFVERSVEAKKVTVKLLRIKGRNSSTFRSTTYSKAI